MTALKEQLIFSGLRHGLRRSIVFESVRVRRMNVVVVNHPDLAENAQDFG